MTILDGLRGLEVVGADVGKWLYVPPVHWHYTNGGMAFSSVEVAPIYDNPGETTVLAAAEVVHSLMALMVHMPVKDSA